MARIGRSQPIQTLVRRRFVVSPAVTPVAFSDPFNRADANNLGSDWQEASLDAFAFTIVNRQAAPYNGVAYAVWGNEDCRTDDNFSQVTVSTRGGASSIGVVARWIGAAGENGYLWRSTGSVCSLFSVVATVYTQIGTDYAHTLVNGSVLKISAVGTTITGYVDGVAVKTVTDSAITTGKNVGMRANSACGLNDWSGGDVTATLVFPTGDVVGSGTTTARATQRSISSSAGVGAITANATVTTPTVTTGRPKVYTGSYVTKPGKVYMGSGPGFVEKPWKRWTGTMWLKLGESGLEPSTETKLIAQYHGAKATSHTVPLTATTPGRALLAITNSAGATTMPAGWVEMRINFSATHLAIWRLDPSLHTTSLTSLPVTLSVVRQLAVVIVEDDIYGLNYVYAEDRKVSNTIWESLPQWLPLENGLAFLALMDGNGLLDDNIVSYTHGFTALADTGYSEGINTPALDEGVRTYVGQNHGTTLVNANVWFTLASPGAETTDNNYTGIVAWSRSPVEAGVQTSLFPDNQVAYPHDAADDDAVTVGTEFSVAVPAKVIAIRFMQPSTNADFAFARTGAIYAVTGVGTGTMVAGPFTMPTGTTGEWTTYTLPTPYTLAMGQRYKVAVFHLVGKYCYYTGGHYFDTTGPGATTTLIDGIITRYNSADSTDGQGTFGYSGTMSYPSGAFNGGCYFSDVIVETTA